MLTEFQCSWVLTPVYDKKNHKDDDGESFFFFLLWITYCVPDLTVF